MNGTAAEEALGAFDARALWSPWIIGNSAKGYRMIRADGSHAPSSPSMMVGAAACLLVSGILGCASMHAETALRSQRPAHLRVSTAGPSGIHLRAGTRLEDDFVYLVLKLGDRRLYVMKTAGNSETREHIESFPVAIGRKRYETPTGRFKVTDKRVDPDWVEFDWENPSRAIRTIRPGPDNPLGVRWIGFASAYGWEIGFHGTPQPELIGQAVSHGCVRMRNNDVVKLYSRVKVGTLVIVQP